MTGMVVVVVSGVVVLVVEVSGGLVVSDAGPRLVDTVLRSGLAGGPKMAPGRDLDPAALVAGGALPVVATPRGPPATPRPGPGNPKARSTTTMAAVTTVVYRCPGVRWDRWNRGSLPGGGDAGYG